MMRRTQPTRNVAGLLLAAFVVFVLTGCYRHVVGGGSGDSRVYEPNVEAPDRKVTPLGPVKK